MNAIKIDKEVFDNLLNASRHIVGLIEFHGGKFVPNLHPLRDSVKAAEKELEKNK